MTAGFDVVAVDSVNAQVKRVRVALGIVEDIEQVVRDEVRQSFTEPLTVKKWFVK